MDIALGIIGNGDVLEPVEEVPVNPDYIPASSDTENDNDGDNNDDDSDYQDDGSSTTSKK